MVCPVEEQVLRKKRKYRIVELNRVESEMPTVFPFWDISNISTHLLAGI